MLSAPDCEVTAWPQRRGRKLVALAGGDPMPGGRSEDCWVLAAQPGPILEPSLDDVNGKARQVHAGLSSQQWPGSMAVDNAQPAADQGQGVLSRSGPDSRTRSRGRSPETSQRAGRTAASGSRAGRPGRGERLGRTTSKDGFGRRSPRQPLPPGQLKWDKRRPACRSLMAKPAVRGTEVGSRLPS